MPGLAWNGYFAAHVEMLGLLNWGMFTEDSDGRLIVHHGNASMIPAEETEVVLEDDRAVVTGSLLIRDGSSVWPQPDAPPLYRTEKDPAFGCCRQDNCPIFWGLALFRDYTLPP